MEASWKRAFIVYMLGQVSEGESGTNISVNF